MARLAAIGLCAVAVVGARQAPAHERGLDQRLRAIAVAIIHQDLAHARADADWIGRRDGIAAELAGPAKAVSSATDLPTAAVAVASLAAACGGCHHSGGATPAIKQPAEPPGGRIVGHMRAHQDAANLLVDGLIAPDGDAWVRGTRQLQAAPLRPGEFPVSDRIGALMGDIETRLHAQALQLERAEGPARAAGYGALLVTCGQCHTRHTSLWERD